MKRPELETDPDKLPGQIINRPPQQAMYLRDIIARIQDAEEQPFKCCHKTVLERCEGCPYI